MRSIRLSLIVYFLSLMALALSGVAYFCYESTQKVHGAKENSMRDALRAKENSTIALLNKQFEDNRVREMTAFDDRLQSQLRNLARKAVYYYDHAALLWMELAALAGQLQNPPLFTVYPTLTAATHPPFVMRVSQPRPPGIRVEAPHAFDDPSQSVVSEIQFFQTYWQDKAQVLPLEHSHTLNGFAWKLDRDTRLKADDNQPAWDEVKVAGQTVRRITMRFNIGVGRRGFVAEPKVDAKGPDWARPSPLPALPKPGEDRSFVRNKPSIYLQYGVETSIRDKAIATLLANRDSDISKLTSQHEIELAKLNSDLDEARMDLRTRLLWIGGGAFAALVFGGFWLVRLGLSPLDRLSDAVSKVSEKDFHLPIDQDALPVELKPIAGRFTATLEQLKRAFEREKQAAADISHELRTPVAALLTMLDITLRKQRTAEEYREVLEDCRTSGHQINKLVERLLMLARLDAGADQLRPREVDVVALADQCVQLVRPLAEARGLQLSVHRNGPASMHADPDKLREVLTNLLHNAIEYNKPNGSIEVQVERTNGTLAMEVRDTGIGISQETRRRIFERFFRADPSRHADDSPHAGLGLAIVKGYVDLMGGSIDVDSTVGTGSTFRVRLPVL